VSKAGELASTRVKRARARETRLIEAGRRRKPALRTRPSTVSCRSSRHSLSIARARAIWTTIIGLPKMVKSEQERKWSCKTSLQIFIASKRGWHRTHATAQELTPLASRKELPVKRRRCGGLKDQYGNTEHAHGSLCSMRLREHAPEAPTIWKMVIRNVSICRMAFWIQYQSTANLSFLAQGFAYTLQLDMDKVKLPSQRRAHAT